jgi:hypothetical protein
MERHFGRALLAVSRNSHFVCPCSGYTGSGERPRFRTKFFTEGTWQATGEIF